MLVAVIAKAWLSWMLAALALLGGPVAADALLSREQALAAMERPDEATRRAAIARLAVVGTMADADRVAAHLADAEEAVYQQAAATLWQIWSRSGDADIDALFDRGIGEMGTGQLEPALATFSEIVRRKPEFAEGWNKRATVLFLLGRHALSLKDCDEVLARNRNHFGALSGAAQIHLRLGQFERARDYLVRALKVHPHLDGAAEMLRLIELHLGTRQRNIT